MATALDTFSLSIGDLLLNARYDDGTVITLPTDGFQGTGAPSVKVGFVERVRADGSIAGTGYNDARHFSATGTATCETEAVAWALRDTMGSISASDDIDVTVTTAADTRVISARREGEVIIDWTSKYSFRYSIGLQAVDPRWTASAPLTGSTGLPASTGGLTFPHVFAHTFNAVSTSGRIDLTNTGNTPGRVTFRITGGVGGIVGPQVTHVTSGLSIVFATTLTLTEGVYVDVDMDAHTILEQGTASRTGWVTERGWSRFEVGANEWQFSAISGVGTLDVSAWPSWL